MTFQYQWGCWLETYKLWIVTHWITNMLRFTSEVPVQSLIPPHGLFITVIKIICVNDPFLCLSISQWTSPQEHSPTLPWKQMNKMYHVYSHTHKITNTNADEEIHCRCVSVCVWCARVRETVHIHTHKTVSPGQFVKICSMTTLDAYTCIIVLLSTPNRAGIPTYINLTYLCSIKINTQWGLKPWNH